MPKLGDLCNNFSIKCVWNSKVVGGLNIMTMLELCHFQSIFWHSIDIMSQYNSMILIWRDDVLFDGLSSVFFIFDREYKLLIFF